MMFTTKKAGVDPTLLPTEAQLFYYYSFWCSCSFKLGSTFTGNPYSLRTETLRPSQDQLFTNLQQKGHRKAAYLTLEPRQGRQASLAEPRRLPPDFTGELRRPKPPRFRLLQETENHLRRGHVGIAGHSPV